MLNCHQQFEVLKVPLLNLFIAKNQADRVQTFLRHGSSRISLSKDLIGRYERQTQTLREVLYLTVLTHPTF